MGNSILTGRSGYSFAGGGGGYAAGFAAGVASVHNEFTSFGKRIFAGETPTVYDPGSLAAGAYSVDVNGDITVSLNTGITAALPSTGYSLVLPAYSSLSRAQVNYAFAWAVARLRIVSQAGTTGGMRVGFCIMDTDDPTTAMGWGTCLTTTTTSTFSTAIRALTAGAWSATTTAANSVAITSPAEGTLVQRTSGDGTQVTVLRISGVTGLAVSGVTATTATNSAYTTASFAGGTWFCLFWGSTDGLITAGDYTLRGWSSTNDSPPNDLVGL